MFSWSCRAGPHATTATTSQLARAMTDPPDPPRACDRIRADLARLDVTEVDDIGRGAVRIEACGDRAREAAITRVACEIRELAGHGIHVHHGEADRMAGPPDERRHVAEQRDEAL